MFNRASLIALAMLMAATATALGATAADAAAPATRPTNSQCRWMLDLGADQLIKSHGKRAVVIVDDCKHECYELVAEELFAQSSLLFLHSLSRDAV